VPYEGEVCHCPLPGLFTHCPLPGLFTQGAVLKESWLDPRIGLDFVEDVYLFLILIIEALCSSSYPVTISTETSLFYCFQGVQQCRNKSGLQ